MATIGQQLTQLESDRQDLVDNLETKGISGLTGVETFTELVPEVLNIPSGGDTFVPYKNTTSVDSYASFIGSWIKDISELDANGSTQLAYLFRNCYNLESIGSIKNSSSATNTRGMFMNCNKITTIPYFDTSNSQYMDSMFNGCTSLTTVPLLDTSSSTTIANMFRNCSSLTTLPLLNTSTVNDMNNFVYSCTIISSIPQYNTINVTNFNNAFRNCSSLTTVPLLDFSSANYITYAFSGDSSLTTLGGCKDLGNAYNTTASANNSSYELTLNSSTNLTEQSIINVLTNLYDIATKGCRAQKVRLGSTNLAKLTSPEGISALTQAQNYGWNIE